MNTFGRGDFRVPRELPMVLQTGGPQAGIGRGFGRGSPAATANPPQPGAMPSLVSKDSSVVMPGSRSAMSDTGSYGGARNAAAFSSGVACNVPSPSFPAGMGRNLGPEGDQKPPGYVKFKDAVANANQPLREIEVCESLKRYLNHLSGM